MLQFCCKFTYSPRHSPHAERFFSFFIISVLWDSQLCIFLTTPPVKPLHIWLGSHQTESRLHLTELWPSLYHSVSQRLTENDENFGKPSFPKCVILHCNLYHFALQSASNIPCDLTQITVLMVSDSTLIQYKLRSYRVQSRSGFTSEPFFSFQNASFRRTCFFM